MRFIGVDFGTKKIGFSLGDRLSGVVWPLYVLPIRGSIEEAVKTIQEVLQKEGAEACVIGLPHPPKGGSSEQLRLTEQVREMVQRTVSLPVYSVDEAFTSKEGKRLIQEHGWQAKEDAIAAVLLLEQFFLEHPGE